MQIVPPKKNEALEQLLRHAHRRRYPAKTPIIQPGDTGDILYYVIEGSVAVTMPNKVTDQDIVITYLNKGDFIGEMGVFMGVMPRDVRVVTREPTQLAEIGYVRLMQLLHNELSEYAIEIMLGFGRQLSNRLLATTRKVGALAFLDVTGRIAHTLAELCRLPEAMTHPEGMQIRITRQELGRIVGCSREMAGKVLKSLDDQGVIKAKGKTIVVLGTR
jgi:CRP/FNR family cyclic AMP-dependent transcriptional regulator